MYLTGNRRAAIEGSQCERWRSQTAGSVRCFQCPGCLQKVVLFVVLVPIINFVDSCLVCSSTQQINHTLLWSVIYTSYSENLCIIPLLPVWDILHPLAVTPDRWDQWPVMSLQKDSSVRWTTFAQASKCSMIGTNIRKFLLLTILASVYSATTLALPLWWLH